MNNKSILAFPILAAFCLAFLTVSNFAYSGGGATQPVNFTDGQVIKGKSFQPVVVIKDPATDYIENLVDKEIEIKANSNLTGAKCKMLGDTSDENGEVKATCKAKEYGQFGFDVVDLDTGLVLTNYQIHFTKNGIQNVYTLHTSPDKNFDVDLNTDYEIEAVLKRDEKETTNYDNVDFFRWEVLEGNLVTFSSSDPKNRILNFQMVEPIETKLKASAVMLDGSVIEAQVVVITGEE